MRKFMLQTITAGLLCAGSAQAASVLYDFNSDPTGILTLYGNSVWNSTGGPGTATNANDGYLTVTPDANSQRGAIVFADFDSGQVVNAFTFEADFRIGNGSQRPADGFSVSYCRANDPVLTDVAASGDPSADADIWNYGPNCENNLPEEGTRTGIAIGFDAWDSGGTAPYCDGLGNADPSNIGPDIVGIDLHVDADLVAQFPMPTLNGSDTDATSLQTGPYDPTNPDDPNVLGWAHLKVELDAPTPGTHTLSIWWKGTQLLNAYPVTYFPTPGRLVFTGRTGNAHEAQDVDNISIVTVPAALALVGSATGHPDGFDVQIGDSGASVVDPTTVTAQLNGSPITPTSVTKVGGTTTVTYHEFPVLLPPGSSNYCFVSSQDTHGNTISGTRGFIVPRYATIPAADAVSGVTATPGFRLQPWQTDQGEPNNDYWMLEQIAGLHGANNANLSQATDNGYIDWTGPTNVINFDIAGPDGNFTVNNGYPDMPFPGIPGANAVTDNSSMNMRMFLHFANPGIYTLGVNSDDGFVVSEGKTTNPDDWFSNLLGDFNGGRGASDTTFLVAVPAAGTYPVRLAWENGGGGANCEFFSINGGVKYLVNDPDPTNTTGIAAYYIGPSLPAYVSAVQPNPGSGGNLPDRVFAQLTDDGTTVVGGSIQLYVNGALTSPVNNHVGTQTTVTLTLDSAHLLAQGANNAALVWSDSGGNNHSNYWTFSVLSYVTLDPSQASPLGSQDTTRPGFLLHVVQVDPCLPSIIDPTAASDCGDGTENDIDSANAMMGGLYFPSFGTNAADVNTTPPVSSNLWLFTGVPDFNINASSLDFTVDNALPGIPTIDGAAGNRPTDSFSAWFDTYVAFPTAGLYIMGVASDDGFRLSEGIGITRQVLHIKGDHVDRDVAAVPSTASTVGGVWRGELPLVPMTAQVAYVDSSECPGPTTMDLTGKIALIDANRCGAADNAGYNGLVAMCQARGAVAVIVQASPGWGTPERMTGGATVINIPALHVIGYNGEKENWHTNGTITATIGRDSHLMIGQADYGKGIDHQDRAFVVPQAGVYPMHLTYEEGGGGTGLEWSSVSPTTGTRILINDTGTPGALLAFQARTPVTPTISISQVGGNTVINFVGTLLSSPNVTGPYTRVPGAMTPYTVPTGLAPTQFYRAGPQE